MQSSSGHENLGRHILLVGLAAQTISYLFFVVLVVYSHNKLRNSGAVFRKDYPWFLFWIVYFSSVFILVSGHPSLKHKHPLTLNLQIRGVFRIAIFAQGQHGTLNTKEG